MKKLLALLLALVLMMSLGVSGYAASGEASAETAVEDDGVDAAITMADSGENPDREQTEGFDMSHFNGGEKTETAVSGFLFESGEAVNFFFSELSEDTGEFYTIGGKAKNLTIADSGADISAPAAEWMEARGVTAYDSAIVLKDGGSSDSFEPVISAKGWSYLNLDSLLVYAEGSARSALYTDVVGGSTIPGAGGGGGGGTTQVPVVVIRDSLLETTGSTGQEISGSISFGNSGGRARGIQPQGKSITYLYNSAVVSRTWGAYSTDSARSSLDLVSYNSLAYSTKGYGSYADTSCHLFLYGSRSVGGSDGSVASNNGEIYGVDTDCALTGTELRTLMGQTAMRDVAPTDYLEAEGDVLSTEIRGGSTAVQFHMPDMGGSGARNTKKGILYMQGGVLATDKELEAEDLSAYTAHYSGACIVTKSAQTNTLLEGTEMISHSGVLIHAMINSDSMANNIADGDAAPGSDYVLRNMDVTGDIINDDYQRALRLTLDGTVLTGAIQSNTCDDWNAFCEAECEGQYILNPEGYETFWGVELTLDGGAVWNVTESSTLASLTVLDGTVNGIVSENADGSITVEPLETEEEELSGEYPLELIINGRPVLSATVAGEIEDGQFRFDLGSLMEALGLALSYDEASGAVSLGQH